MMAGTGCTPPVLVTYIADDGEWATLTVVVDGEQAGVLVVRPEHWEAIRDRLEGREA